MRLIFFDPDRELENSYSFSTKKIISMYSPVFCKSHEEFSKALVAGGYFSKILILNIKTTEDIKYLNTLQHLLRGTKMFLIVPSDSTDIIKQAYSLNPRLIASSKEDIKLMMESILSYVERINTST